MFRLPICEQSRLTPVACICPFIQRHRSVLLTSTRTGENISTRCFDEQKHCCIGVIEENVHIKYMSMLIMVQQ